MATTNYSWNLPTVGGSEDTWGTQLNANWTALDTLLGGVSQAEFATLDGVGSNIQTQLNTLTSNKADKTTSISAGAGLTGGGDLSTNRTLSHADTSSQGSVSNSGSTFIQSITLDTYGHITALSSGTVSAPTTAQVLSATAGLTAGDVGTYAILRSTSQPGSLSLGSTYAGSSLRYQAIQGISFSSNFELQSLAIPANVPSGTWRSLSQVPTTTDGNWAPVGLFVRIS